MLKSCENCQISQANGGTCWATHLSDGHYGWGTPVHDGDMDSYPSYCWESLHAPRKDKDGNVGCFAWSALPQLDAHPIG